MELLEKVLFSSVLNHNTLGSGKVVNRYNCNHVVRGHTSNYNLEA